jgi:ribosomal protein S18 acetylase RimI-like enzyme
MELVECDKKYWEFVRSLRNDKNNLSGFIETKHISPEDQQAFMKINSRFFKTCLLDEEPVGYIGLIGENKDEITFCVAHNNKGNGIGSFMVKDFTKNISCWAKVRLENINSSKIFEKLGFKKETIKNFNYYEK